MWGYTDGGGVQDQYKEELVRNITKQIQHSKQPGRPPANTYDKLKQKLSEWDLPTPSKNLFIDLMQKIAQELNITGCWIYGGSQMTEQWPWRRERLTTKQILLWNQTRTSLKENRPEGWTYCPPNAC